ncbi:unnamed protein product [Triticum turgidum subsp. durum]|uniref:Uncharacterized protein n=1 Tax=Triticum turgidum subsp. durum TaxID=4567 RepID=A0A9R1Q5H0_TRITD|nr:unnamed protein product [Triticum turgidum subsp. durum]
MEDTVVPTFVPLRCRSNPDLAAAVRGADFLLGRLPVPEGENDAVFLHVPVPVPEDDEDAIVYEWSICDCHDGFVLLGSWSTQQLAVYNPLTRTLDLFPLPPDEDREGFNVDFHILASEQDYRLFRVVCVRHNERGARAVVLSSNTRKWQMFP